MLHGYIMGQKIYFFFLANFVFFVPNFDLFDCKVWLGVGRSWLISCLDPAPVHLSLGQLTIKQWKEQRTEPSVQSLHGNINWSLIGHCNALCQSSSVLTVLSLPIHADADAVCGRREVASQSHKQQHRSFYIEQKFVVTTGWAAGQNIQHTHHDAGPRGTFQFCVNIFIWR